MAVPAAPNANWVLTDLASTSVIADEITLTEASPNWNPVDYIEVRYSTASNFSTYSYVRGMAFYRDTGGGGTPNWYVPSGVVIEDLTPNTLYYARAYAHNSSGYSAQAGTTRSFTTYPGVDVNVNGSWRPSTPYINVDGVWKPAERWVNVSGVWKK